MTTQDSERGDLLLPLLGLHKGPFIADRIVCNSFSVIPVVGALARMKEGNKCFI